MFDFKLCRAYGIVLRVAVTLLAVAGLLALMALYAGVHFSILAQGSTKGSINDIGELRATLVKDEGRWEDYKTAEPPDPPSPEGSREQPTRQCAMLASVAKQLSEKWDEVAVLALVTENGGVITVFGNPEKGNWTLTFTEPNSLATCVISGGLEWGGTAEVMAVLLKQKGQGT